MTKMQGTDISGGEICSLSRSPSTLARSTQPTKQKHCSERATSPSTSSELLASETVQPVSSPFLFINTQEKNGKQKAESRMLVRSHVMSSFYRKKSSPQSHEETLPRDGESGGQQSKFRLESYSQRRKPKRRRKTGSSDPISKTDMSDMAMTIPKSFLGAGPLDPFAVAAFPWDSHMQHLVRHYVADIPDSIHPLNHSNYYVQNFILRMAITDEALLHAIVAYSMIHKFCFGTSALPSHSEKIEYATTNPDVLGHQTQTIRLLNQKISLGKVDDATIATILILLWHHPWIQGAGEDEALIHFAGLKQMVEYRGGLEILPEPLANSIIFHGLKRSMLTASKPQFPISRASLSLTEIDVPRTNASSIFSRSPTYLAPLLGTQLWQTLLDLNQFTAFISYYQSHPNEYGRDECTAFEHWNSSLEHRLLSYSSSEQDISICDNMFREALRLAAVLWMSTGLWTFPLSSSLVASMAGDLVDILMESDLDLWRESFPEMLLWIFVIGGCCTPTHGSRREFLLGHLKFIAKLRGFGGIEDLVQALRSFIYMDEAYAVPLVVLWRDIGEDGLG